jgi:dTDP-4-dehydrorhamnose 3,5-epimerase
MTGEWLLPGATRDRQTITAEWNPANLTLIDGVRLREVRNVPKANGHLTEIYRRDWALDDAPVDQIFQVVLVPGGISAWHAHGETIDRLFVIEGTARVVLYDAREGSPTRGLVNEFKLSALRPALVVIPPRVWHGVQNIGHEYARMLNVVDRAYDYSEPDHWRVPEDCPGIPYAFARA